MQQTDQQATGRLASDRQLAGGRQTGEQRRQAGGQRDRQTGRRTDRQTGKRTGKRKDGQASRQIGIQTERYTDRQALQKKFLLKKKSYENISCN